METIEPLAKYLFNFTQTEGLNQHIWKITLQMRQEIQIKRKTITTFLKYQQDKNKKIHIQTIPPQPKEEDKYIKYQAIVQKTKAHVFPGWAQFGGVKKYQAKSIDIKRGDKIVLKLSTLKLYPFDMGYTIVNQKKQECYHLTINGEKFTMVGVTYDSGNQLGDILGILVAEQIRFNTMEIILKINDFKDKYANDLVGLLMLNFKGTIYNNWKSTWDIKKVKVNNLDVSVEKIIKAID